MRKNVPGKSKNEPKNDYEKIGCSGKFGWVPGSHPSGFGRVTGGLPTKLEIEKKIDIYKI